jgi:antitoxin CptB
MRELDVLLQAFAESAFDELDDADMSRFEAILNLSDPELHAYLVGGIEAADRDDERLLDRIRRSLQPRA